MNYYYALNKRLKKATGDFSLLELIIVISIIGFLFIISAIGLIHTNRRAMNERVVDDLNFIEVALEDYYREHNNLYPIPAEDQTWIDLKLIGERYFKTEKQDPHSKQPYAFAITPDGEHYQLAGLQKEANGEFNVLVRGSTGLTEDLITVKEGQIWVKNNYKRLPYPPEKE